MAKIAWFVPSLLEGSGGHRTILHHAHMLQSCGHEIFIYLENDARDSTALIEKLFSFRFPHVFNGWHRAVDMEFDMAFATIWYSAKFVRDLRGCRLRCYFVQDYEAYFNPMGDAYLMAENSYKYGLSSITIGRWLAAEIRNKYTSRVDYFDFCADASVYHDLAVPRKDQVCFIYQPDKPRRCAELGVEALGIVKARRPETKIVLYGSIQKGSIWFDHEHLGLISLDKCNALYNESAVGLCISSSNPSRIPFEMMAAGLPVVELYRDCTIYDLPPRAVQLADQTPEAIAEAIISLLDDGERRREMSAAGRDFMRERGNDRCESQFLNFCKTLLTTGKCPEPHSTLEPYTHNPVRFEGAPFVRPTSPAKMSNPFQRLKALFK